MEKEYNKIESYFLVCCLLDLFGSNIFGIIYKDLLTVIKNPNDTGEILLEYISFFLSRGGITNFAFEDGFENSSNILFMASLLLVLLNYENDDNLFFHIKKSIKVTLEKIYKDVDFKILTDSISTDNEMFNIDMDNKYIGKKNANYLSDICVRIIPIGLIYHDDVEKMIQMSIKISNLTHNNTISNLSSIATTYFVSLAIRDIPVEQWCDELIVLLESEKIKKYIDFNDNKNIMDYSTFVKYWMSYRDNKFYGGKIKKTKSDDNLIFRAKFYKNYIYNESDNLLGRDCLNCIIITYDALLSCGGNFEKMVYYGILIPGEIMSISGILGALFGLVYGTKTIPLNFLKNIFFVLENEQIKKMVEKLNNKILKDA